MCDVGKTWKGAIVACFKILFQRMLEGTEEDKEKFNQGNWSPSRGSNPGPSEYEAVTTGLLR
jgi:hypothetical protein